MDKTQEVISAFFKDNFGWFEKNTVDAYERALRQFFSSCPKQVDDIVPKDIKDWRTALHNEGRAPRTIHLKLAALRSFFGYCMEENLIIKNPTTNIKSPKIHPSPLSSLNREELIQFKEVTRINQRDRVMIETLYVTGTRISELLSIQVSDIKWLIWIGNGKGDIAMFPLTVNVLND